MVGYQEHELVTLDAQLSPHARTGLDVVHRNWRQITHPDDLETSRQAIEQLVTESVPSVEFEKRYLHRQGRVIWARVKASIVRDIQGHQCQPATSAGGTLPPH